MFADMIPRHQQKQIALLKYLHKSTFKLTVSLIGVIGGEHYTHQGGGVNYLCLPNRPKYGNYKNGYQSSGRMFGTEYEVNSVPNLFKKQNLHDHDAPCVVCYVSSRGSMLMMPARNDCPAGWTQEYHGYLMTEYYGHKKQRDFICVDEDAEYVPGSGANQNGALLYVAGRSLWFPSLSSVCRWS